MLVAVLGSMLVAVLGLMHVAVLGSMLVAALGSILVAALGSMLAAGHCNWNYQSMMGSFRHLRMLPLQYPPWELRLIEPC